MGARKGCQACRDRHIKCIREHATDKCQKCLEKNRACLEAASLRFRPLTSVNLKTSDKRKVKQTVTFNSSHRWVVIPEVEFVPGSSHSIASSLTTRAKRTRTDQDDDVFSDVSDDSAGGEPSMQPICARDFALESLTEHTPLTAHADITLCDNGSLLEPSIDEITPGSLREAHEQSRIALITSATLFNIRSPVSSIQGSWPFVTEHQAQLFKHYVRELAPWVDSCDNLTHFATEIPRRVPFYPILASAIYALSSRHLSLLNGTKDEESSHYAERCIQMLIKSLDDPFAQWDENLLAAIVIMRLHEELGQEQDLCYHLLGTRKILDSISAFAADGGLREAASWVSLRQHIYISLTAQQPLGITLQNFFHSSVFCGTSTSNEDWAKRIILIFARILDHAFTPPEESQDETTSTGWWNKLKAELDTWHRMKPWDFAPLWTNLGSGVESAFTTPGSVPGTTTTPHDTPPGYATAKSTFPPTHSSYIWPDLLVAHRSQITGLQYYHLARVALALYDPNLVQIGFTSIRARQASEKIVVDGIKNIVGLSASNEGAKNAMFEASHVLQVCGGYLRKEAEQNAAVAFLEMVQRKLGWRTHKTIEELRRTWAND